MRESVSILYRLKWNTVCLIEVAPLHEFVFSHGRCSQRNKRLESFYPCCTSLYDHYRSVSRIHYSLFGSWWSSPRAPGRTPSTWRGKIIVTLLRIRTTCIENGRRIGIHLLLGNTAWYLPCSIKRANDVGPVRCFVSYQEKSLQPNRFLTVVCIHAVSHKYFIS